MNAKRILIADDDPIVRQSLMLMFFGEGIAIDEASSLNEAYQKISVDTYDILLLDVHFQNGETSLSLLERMRAENKELPVIMLSGAASTTEAVRAIRIGAYDFLEKPPNEELLRLVIDRCLEDARLKSTLAALSGSDTNLETSFMGESEQSAEIRKKISRFASKDISVLITGETGTGKEVVAQCLRQGSSRLKKNFVAINAAAIPESLIESELFGHKKGSFSGAISNNIGKIGAANGGILFLDEIGDLSQASQSKLLRFLETGEIQSVGSTQTNKVDVRVIAATSRDLQQEIKRNHFRSDLFYRLSVANIHIPPLRERPEDIEPLFLFFVSQFAKRHQENIPSITSGAMALLRGYAWPGNVRELRNMAERLIVQVESEIDTAVVRNCLAASIPPTENTNIEGKFPASLVSLKEYKTQMEREYIEHVLSVCENNVTRAAEILNLERSHLHQVITRLGVRRP
jgi:two-component system nitrogen regulation response regulator NtrX